MQQAAPEFLIGPLRVLTMREMTFFYVVSQPVPFADLDKVLDPLKWLATNEQALWFCRSEVPRTLPNERWPVYG